MKLNTEKIRELRLSKGFTQVEVAKTMGYTNRNSYSQVETGKREPNLHRLSLLAGLYDVTLDELTR
ncbi:helix-turn-helix domain-containing protein [Bacillus mycoides]|uniref:Transcriptional regulator n=1 Tax=Bacillus mycoides TaxID=1405 RepID=A0A1W6AJM2_BACMY|nr:helix-turn-helix transcriptional regulator [Bacillus mycoides]ARJ26043.1 transcriptional regulator [Bacillus mycoides]TKI86814.1 helix-turn-helix transcriptional regulator [Bacillus mycoides]